MLCYVPQSRNSWKVVKSQRLHGQSGKGLQVACERQAVSFNPVVPHVCHAVFTSIRLISSCSRKQILLLLSCMVTSFKVFLSCSFMIWPKHCSLILSTTPFGLLYPHSFLFLCISPFTLIFLNLWNHMMLLWSGLYPSDRCFTLTLTHWSARTGYHES